MSNGNTPHYDLIQPARLTKAQLAHLGLKKAAGNPPGNYISTVHNLLRIRELKLIVQYRNNRGLKTDPKTGMLRLNRASIATLKREFDPFALGTFGFALQADGTLLQSTAHHRLEVCAQMKEEGYDFSGISVMVTIVEADSHLLHYTREGEQWSQTMGQRVTNPDLLYGHYYGHIIEQARLAGYKLSATNLPKAQVSQVVEAILLSNEAILKVKNFGTVWNGRHEIKKKANTPFSIANRNGELLDSKEEFQIVEAALYLNSVLESVKHLPIPMDAVKELVNLPMFKGLIFCCRAGLTHQERTKAPTPTRWVTQEPARLAVRLATSAQALRKEAQMISSGSQPEQALALHNLDRILSKPVKNEKAIGAQIMEKLLAHRKKYKLDNAS